MKEMPPMQNEMTVKEMYDDLKHLIEGITNQFHDIHAEIKTLKARVNVLEDKNKEDNNCLITIQRELRKNNLIIFGLSEEEEENLLHKVIELFGSKLKVQVSALEINNIYRFGRSKKNRPVIVKFVSFYKKLQILKNGILLKGANVSISNDLIKEDREKQNILRKHLKLARSQGLEAKIVNFKLLLGDTYLTVNDLLKIEEKQQTESEQTQSLEAEGTTTEHSQNKEENIKILKNQEVIRQQDIPSALVSKHKQTKLQQNHTIYSEYITRSKSSQSQRRRKK